SGFTWRDDYTQHVIGQELSTLHKIHSRRPDVFASEGSDTARRQNPKDPSPGSQSQQEFPEGARGRTLRQRQPDQLPPEPRAGQRSLMAALHSYITQNLSAHSSENSPPSRTKGSQVYAESLYSSQGSPFDGTLAKGKVEDFKMRKLLQPRPGFGDYNLPVFSFKNNIILLIQDNTAKLIRFLNENALAEKMHKDLIPEEPAKTETKKSEETDPSSSEETNAGVENVKSETFSRELTPAQNSESDSKDPSQTSYWIKNTLMQEGNSNEKPQKNTGQGLQLEVKSSQEEEYGYIVTVKEIEGNRIVEDSCFIILSYIEMHVAAH
uniref:Uncharacterized protein n=1 Tax=Junco hyemalis TaxID=40217 RepID=A0A8C5NL76_JUNHY